MEAAMETLLAHASKETRVAYADCMASLQALQHARTSNGDVAAAVHTLDSSIASALSRMMTARVAARRELIVALERTAPTAIFVPTKSADAVRLDPGRTTRFMWLLAVAGQGDQAGLDAWNRYAKACARWLSEFVLYSVVEEIIRTPLTNIESTARRARVMETTTRLRWISDAMCTALGEWADTHPAATTTFGPSVMAAVNRSVEMLLGPQRGIADATTFQGIPAPLLGRLTAPRSMPQRCEELLLSTDPQTMPLVEVDGHLQAVNAADWYLGREVAIIAAMRSTLAGVTGAAYEAAIVSVTQRIAPPDVTATHSAHLGFPGRSKNEADEVDFLLTAENLVVIGEAKAHVPASSTRGAASSYTDQLLHSVDQLDTRLRNAADGAVILDHPTDTSARHVIGLSLPLHDYGGTAWRGDAMKESDVPPHIVMPLHGYVLALSCLEDGEDLAGYLAYRATALRAPYAGLDELEPLIAWMSGAAGANPMLPEGFQVGAYRVYELQHAIILGHPVPQQSHRASWIEAVYAYALPVAGDPLAPPGSQYVDVSGVFDRLEAHIHDVLTTRRPFSFARVADMPTWISLWQMPEIAAASVMTAAIAARSHLPDGALASNSVPANKVEAEALLLLTGGSSRGSLEPDPELMTDPRTVSTLLIQIIVTAAAITATGPAPD